MAWQGLDGRVHPWTGIEMGSLRLPAAVLAAFLAAAAVAAPVKNDTEGIYSDSFADITGLAYVQNVNVGPALTPGVRVSLGKWNWTQSYTPESETIYTPFSHPLASYRIGDLMVNTCATCLEESVGLWRRTYAAGRDFDLHPTAPGGYCCEGRVIPDPDEGTVECLDHTHCPRGHQCCEGGRCCPANVACAYGIECSGILLNHWVVKRMYAENMSQEYLMTGPRQTGLLPNRDYTVTFRVAYEAPPSVNTAELAVFDVSYGATKMTSVPVAVGEYGNGGSFWGSGDLSPVTLEYRVLDPLPAGAGWEYRVKVTLTTTGTPINPDDPTPPCGATAACSATLWIDTVTVQSQGLGIPVGADPSDCGDLRAASPAFKKQSDCAIGKVPCGGECIDVGVPCGWDAATYYVSSGSYVSHVFDSLSENTVWDRVVWEMEQNYASNMPTTPIAIKWRVGNSPDPTIWLDRPTWYTWTIPFTVTCQGERNLNCDPNCRSNFPAPDSECDCRGERRSLLSFPCQTETMPYGFATVYPPPMPNAGEYPLFANGDVDEPLKGRYFQYEIDMTSHFANSKHPPENTTPGGMCELHDTPSPLLKLFRVFYKPASGQVVSGLVRPAKLKEWKKITWERDVTSGGTVQLDVLDAAGVPLFTNVPYPEFDIAGLDVATYPALKLRATIDNGGERTKRPTLRSWRVTWDVYTEPLRVECNGISLSEGEKCPIIVVVNTARQADLTVHDSAGQLVKELFRGTIPAGQINFQWDGTNSRGERVSPGVYFISLKAKKIRRVARVAVLE